MNDGLDRLVNDLQAQADAKAREVYGEAAFTRWNERRHMGELAPPCAHGAVTGSCGDTITLYLRFENDAVAEAGYATSGCGASQVAGSMAAELALGKSLDELSEIGGEEILAALGGLPDDKTHCAHLAASALHEAVGGHLSSSRTAT